MSAKNIVDLWPYWIVGLVIFPLVAILPQLANIRAAVARSKEDPKQAALLFLTPRSIVLSVVFGMLTFVCLVLFLGVVLVGIVAAIRNLFA